MTLGKEVRLKNAYIIKGESVVKDANGTITEIHCTADLDSRSGSGTEASTRRVKGTLHWVSIKHAVKAEIRVYDRLFLDEAPDSHKDADFMQYINPKSLEIIKTAFVEPFLAKATVGTEFQFQRLGYFNVDTDSTADHLVFNKTVGLKDSWKPVTSDNQKQNTGGDRKPQQQQAQKNPISEIKKLGKKYANLSGPKLDAAKAKILKYAEEVSYDDLEPLFETPTKKVGIRIATVITLNVLLQKGQERTEAINIFIESAQQDSHDMMIEEVKAL